MLDPPTAQGSPQITQKNTGPLPPDQKGLRPGTWGLRHKVLTFPILPELLVGETGDATPPPRGARGLERPLPGSLFAADRTSDYQPDVFSEAR
jgi:hypothetical protein